MNVTPTEKLALEGWVFFDFCFFLNSYPTVYFIMVHFLLLFSAKAVQNFD